MIDAITNALQNIHRDIPPQILEAAFKPYASDKSIDSLIVERIFLANIQSDLSIRGGKILKLIVNQNWCRYTTSPSPYALGISGAYTVFHIPPEARENRDIACVLGVRFPYTLGTSNSCSFYNNNTLQGNTLSGLATAALQTQTGSNMLAVPQAMVKPGNIIQLDPPQYNFIPWEIIVRLMFDSNFSGMDVSSIETFCKLCTYATQKYIWTNLIFDIETNMVMRGAEVGVMKDIVNSYADAGEKYDELLIAFGGAQLYEPDRLRNILTRMVPKK